MLAVSKQVATEVLESMNGTFFSVSFIKRSEGLLPVWEVNKGYKMIPLSNVTSFNAHGAEFVVPSKPVL